MNQEKIGKFIALNRKKKNLTQEELAEKLNISKNAVSKWERGLCLMDMSLLKPLSEILDVTINEILQGEYLEEKQDKFEENILNTIDYSHHEVLKKDKIIGIIVIILGIIITITSFSIFKSASSWGSFYAIVGLIIFLIGLTKLIRRMSYLKRLIILLTSFIIYTTILLLIDYLSVISLKQAPRFSFGTEYHNNVILYRGLFYNVYQVNYDTVNEYYIIDNKKELSIDTIVNLPFNYDKCNIKNLLKYQSNNIQEDNIKSLLNDLPLEEYGYHLDINNDELLITYYITPYYVNNNYYLEKSLLYNTVSIFTLISDVNTIKYQLPNKEYIITRDNVLKNYPNFKEITNKYLNKEGVFKNYVYDVLIQNAFVSGTFKTVFIDEPILRTKKIIVSGKKEKIITDKNKVDEIINILIKARMIESGTPVTSEGNTYTIELYDNNLIYKFMVWHSSFGFNGKEYLINPLDVEKFNKLLDT